MLDRRVVEAVENVGFFIGEIKKQDNVFYVEINQSTPLGEDWWETIRFDGTDEGFIDGVKDRYNGFDVDEEVEIWIEGRGENGVPSSIRRLVEDAEWKEKKLNELEEELSIIDWSE